MGKFTVVSAKLPNKVYKELALRIPEGERSAFIREAILEKLEKTPRPDRVLGLEQKVNQLENDVNKIKDCLAKLEILTYEGGKVNPHAFCIDEIDNKIVDYILDHRGATTTEIAEFLEEEKQPKTMLFCKPFCKTFVKITSFLMVKTQIPPK